MIQQGVDILVATPGRFTELYLRGDLPTKEIKTLVLDEADRMMDMGFMRQLGKFWKCFHANVKTCYSRPHSRNGGKTFC